MKKPKHRPAKSNKSQNSHSTADLELPQNASFKSDINIKPPSPNRYSFLVTKANAFVAIGAGLCAWFGAKEAACSFASAIALLVVLEIELFFRHRRLGEESGLSKISCLLVFFAALCFGGGCYQFYLQSRMEPDRYYVYSPGELWLGDTGADTIGNGSLSRVMVGVTHNHTLFVYPFSNYLTLTIQNTQPIPAVVRNLLIEAGKTVDGPWETYCEVDLRGMKMFSMFGDKGTTEIYTVRAIANQLTNPIPPGGSLTGFIPLLCPNSGGCRGEFLRVSITDMAHTSHVLVRRTAKPGENSYLEATLDITGKDGPDLADYDLRLLNACRHEFPNFTTAR